MADRYPYGTAGYIIMMFLDPDNPTQYLTSAPALSNADFKIIKNDAAPAARDNVVVPTWLGGGAVKVPLDATDVQFGRFIVQAIDAAPKEWVDNSKEYFTEGQDPQAFWEERAHQETLVAGIADIQAVVDDTNAEVKVYNNYKADVSALALQATSVSILAEVQNYPNYKADVSALALQSTLTSVAGDVTTALIRIGTPQDLNGNGPHLAGNNIDIYAAVTAITTGLTATEKQQLKNASDFAIGDVDMSFVSGTGTYVYKEPGVGTTLFTHTLTKPTASTQQRRVTFP